MANSVDSNLAAHHSRLISIYDVCRLYPVTVLALWNITEWVLYVPLMNGWMVALMLGHFQQYVSHIRTIGGLSWNAMCGRWGWCMLGRNYWGRIEPWTVTEKTNKLACSSYDAWAIDRTNELLDRKNLKETSKHKSDLFYPNQYDSSPYGLKLNM